VLTIDTREGQTVIAAQQAPKILTLGDLSRMDVWAQVSEADVVRIKPGQQAYFSLLGAPEQKHTGVVREIQPTPEKISNAMFYRVLFDVPNPEHILRTDMTAQVGVILQSSKGALLLPLTALGNQLADGRYKVRVLKDKAPPQERTVRIGIRSRSHAQVLEGLSEGERVVTTVEDATPGSMTVSVSG